MGEKPDKMKITFLNTPFYLIPEDPSLDTIPNGFQMSIDLPPQRESQSVAESVPGSTKATLLALITSNAWLAFMFGVSMQQLLDLINSLQITALLPLTNITIPSEAFEFFEVILAIVAFDFFDPYDPGFTETEAYNVRMEWFGFDNVNFVGILGTFLAAVIIYLMV